MKQLKFSLLLLFLLLVLSASIAFAQGKSVVVERRDAEITLHKEGNVDVTETWVVDFQGGPFHFAFRTIPFEKISSLVFDGVSENGKAYTRDSSEAPNTYTIDSPSGERTITWYFATTENATRTFQLTYHMTDALRVYDGGDQFWWKFVESDRAYTINSSHVTLHLPSNFEVSQLKAATYINGNETGGAQIVDGQTIEFSGGPFPPDTEWEIRAQFPHGVVTQSVQAWQTEEDQAAAAVAQHDQVIAQFNFFSLVTTIVLLVGGGLSLLLLWFLGGRDRAVALGSEFMNAPPTDPTTNAPPLTSALAGTLIDEEANVRDILSTLIDWAQRGIIQIRAVPNSDKNATPNDDYNFEKVGTDAPPLQYQYERDLMQRLWQGEKSRSIGYIREKFTDSLQVMFDGLYDELVQLGYFQSRPDRVRAMFYRFGWLLLVLICPAAFLFQIFVGMAYDTDLPFSFIALAPWIVLLVLSGALMYLARYMPRKTPKGAAAAARWHAFRRYLENVEKYTNVADAKDQFEKYLPYAVAFGLDKTWVEKFAAVGTPAPTWYTPPATTHTVFSSSSSGSTSTTHPATGGVLSVGGAATGGLSSAPSSAPSLNDAAGGAFNSLNTVSSSFFSMLNTTATSFVASNPTLSPRSGSYRSGSSGSSSWSGGSSFHSSSSSFHSSGSSFHSSGGGGGGHSGFG